jgi:hypothetical protein
MPPSKKKKTARGAASSVPEPDDVPDMMAAEDFSPDLSKVCHPGDGGCIAEALHKLGVFKTRKQAVDRLDEITETWQQVPTDLRADQKQKDFLGVPGSTWHVQAVQRAVLSAQYNFHKVRLADMLTCVAPASRDRAYRLRVCCSPLTSHLCILRTFAARSISTSAMASTGTNCLARRQARVGDGKRWTRLSTWWTRRRCSCAMAWSTPPALPSKATK